MEFHNITQGLIEKRTYVLFFFVFQSRFKDSSEGCVIEQILTKQNLRDLINKSRVSKLDMANLIKSEGQDSPTRTATDDEDIAGLS